MQTKPTYTAANGPNWDWETLYKYIQDELSPAQNEAIEAEIEADPLLADTLAGLREIQDPQALKQRLERIRNRSHARLQPQLDLMQREANSKRQSRIRPKLYPQLTMGIAAGILLLVVGVWTIRKNGQETASTEQPVYITDATEPTPFQPEAKLEEATSAPSADGPEGPVLVPSSSEVKSPLIKEKESLLPISTQEIATEEEQITEVEDISFQDEAQVTPSYQPSSSTDPNTEVLALDTAPSVVGVDEDEGAMARQAQPPLPPTNDDFADSEMGGFGADDMGDPSPGKVAQYLTIPPSDTLVIGDSEESASKLKDSVYKNYYKVPHAESNIGRVSKVMAISDMIIAGRTAYEQNQLTKAQDLFSEVLISEPGNLVAHYYLGRTLLDEGSPKKALKTWKPVLDKPDSPVYEATRFYTAEAYWKLGKEKMALNLWEAIAQGRGEFAQRASDQWKLHQK